jgi:hypothetical protein
MGIAELLETEEARGLVEAAQQAGGSITMEEIAGALDELEVDAAVIDEFYLALEELGIEIAGRPSLEEEEEEGARRGAREVSTDALACAKTENRPSPE